MDFSMFPFSTHSFLYRSSGARSDLFIFAIYISPRCGLKLTFTTIQHKMGDVYINDGDTITAALIFNKQGWSQSFSAASFITV